MRFWVGIELVGCGGLDFRHCGQGMGTSQGSVKDEEDLRREYIESSESEYMQEGSHPEHCSIRN